jgi:hypothetical protein
MMLFRSKFTLIDAFETFMLIAFLGLILCFPTLVESGFEEIGRQVHRFEMFSNEITAQLSAYANQLSH